METFECETAIIGSGVAGISAAINFLNNGYKDFLVLEAMDRIGGRCFTSRVENGFLEHGAQLIHGQFGNPIFDLALANNLIVDEDRKLVDIGQDDLDIEAHELLNTMDMRLNHENLVELFISESGEEIPSDWVKKFFDSAEKTFHLAQNYFKNKQQSEPDVKVGSFLESKYMELVDQQIGDVSSENLRKIAIGIFNWRFKWENLEKGCPNLFDHSLRHLKQYTQLRGSQVVKLKRGYCDVLEALVRDNRDQFEARLRLEHVLEKILLCETLQEGERNSCEHCKFTPDPDKMVLLVESKSKTKAIICKFTICTMSLGCLKHRLESLIEPRSFLPEEKLDAVRKLGFGSWNKVFLIYSEPFWEANFQGLHPIWLSEDVEEAFAAKNEPKNWLQRLVSFKPVHSHKSSLCAYIVSESVEELSDDEVSRRCSNWLRKLLNRTDIPEPESILRSRWFSNPYIRGTYSNLKFGSTPADFDSLAQPICLKNRPYVLFAGEATHKTNFSTVHGAFFTGVRESERILRLR